MDGTSVKVRPDGAGARKKNGPQSIGKSRGGWNIKIHMVAADARTAVAFTLSPGNAHHAPEGRGLLGRLEGPANAPAPVPQAPALSKHEFFHNHKRPRQALDHQTPNEHLVQLGAARTAPQYSEKS